MPLLGTCSVLLALPTCKMFLVADFNLFFAVTLTVLPSKASNAVSIAAHPASFFKYLPADLTPSFFAIFPIVFAAPLAAGTSDRKRLLKIEPKPAPSCIEGPRWYRML